MNGKHKENNSGRWLALAFAFIFLTAMFATVAGVRQGKAQEIPYLVYGYVFESDGTTPIEGVTVHATSGTVSGTNDTDVTGAFLIDMTGCTDGDSVLVWAINGTEGDSETIVVDLGSSDYTNLTMGEGTGFGDEMFVVTFFCFDGNGDGVENVNITITDENDNEVTITTNETGIALYSLADGLFTFVAESDDEDLRNQTDDFEISGDNLTVLIDMTSLGDNLQNLLGYEITDDCLFLLAAAIVIGLVLLVGVHGKMNEAGSMGAGTVLLIVLAVIVGLVILGGYTFDLSVSGILELFGFSYGTITAATPAVGLFLLICATVSGSLISAMCATRGGKASLRAALFFAGLVCFTMLLVPGFPNIAWYGFLLGCVFWGALAIYHFNPGVLPEGETAKYLGIGVGLFIALGAAFLIYNYIQAPLTSTLFVAAAGVPLIAIPSRYLKRDDKGAMGMFSGLSVHLVWVFVIGLAIVAGFAVYGAVKIAADTDVLVISFGLLDTYHAYTVGFFIVGGLICAVCAATGVFGGKYKSWFVFGAVVGLALGGALYLYWYKVLPVLGLGMVVGGAGGLFAKRENGLAFNIKKDEVGSAGFREIVLAAVCFIGIPLLWVWANHHYGILEGAGMFMEWISYVVAVTIGYVASYVFKLHQ